MICTGCGVAIVDGAAGCQRVFEELVARDLSDVLYGRWHLTLVDAYCLQHPDRYCASAKSLAAHLGGLCCAVEHAASADTYRALQRWLDGPSPLKKPVLPSARGDVTIADVRAAGDPAAHGAAVDRWARAVWEAYAPLHATAREVLVAALGARRTAR